jgi:hypothetical protein
VIRRWGRIWYGVGIVGAIVLSAIWIITRMPGNPITGIGFEPSAIGFAVQVFEWAFISLAAAILVLQSRMKMLDKKLPPMHPEHQFRHALRYQHKDEVAGPVGFDPRTTGWLRRFVLLQERHW